METTKKKNRGLLLRTVIATTLALGIGGCSVDEKQDALTPQSRIEVFDYGGNTFFENRFSIPARPPSIRLRKYYAADRPYKDREKRD